MDFPIRFKYSDIEADRNKVSFYIENTGKFAGEEITQLYIGLKESNIFRSKFELRDLKRYI